MSEPLSLQQLGRILLGRWLLVLLCSVAGALSAVGLSLLMQPVYTATATQLVKGLPGKGTAANYEAAQFAVNRAKSYPSFVYSAPVLEGVRSDLDDAQTIPALRKDLSATNPADTPLVVITARGSTAAVAREKANSAARHLARFITQIETVAGTAPIGVETAVEASLPTDTTSPKRTLMGAVGVLVGFAIGGLIALVSSFRRTKRAEQVSNPSWWDEGSAGSGDGSPESTVDESDLRDIDYPGSTAAKPNATNGHRRRRVGSRAWRSSSHQPRSSQ